MQSQLDIYKGILGGKGQHKVQEEYEALAQSHGGTIQRFPHPKGKMLAWAPNTKQDITRVPMYGKSLPFTTCHF